MPIPTDTFWNISRLNRIFAVSAVLLVAITGWSIVQDYHKQWRTPQRNAKVWEAALVDERIEQELTPEKKAQLADLQTQIAEKQTRIEEEDDEYQQITARINELENKRSATEFSLNNLKSSTSVLEAQLQDAVTAGDSRSAQDLERKLVEPRQQVTKGTEELAKYNGQIEQLREELKQKTAEMDALTREKTRLSSEVEMLQKKLATLRPEGLLPTVSTEIRRAPLMQFINPAEKVQQLVLPDVLTDVAFLKITTIDRCTTCHVNIAKKDFTEENVLDYLQEQVATARGYNLPEIAGTRAADPSATADRPGAVAMPEFWHNWASELLSDAEFKARGNGNRVNSLLGQIGKTVTVTWDGEPVASLKFDPAATDDAVRSKQDEVLTRVLDAWLRFRGSSDGGASVESVGPHAKVTIAGDVEERVANQQRNLAMKYIEVTADNLRAGIDAAEFEHLRDRYRYALTGDEALVKARKERGLGELDPSPVMLAHPRLDLYVDIDSPHNMESVGCTSCHDGSGQETDFVLAAHTPKPIWVDSKTGEPVLPEQLTNPPVEHHKPTMASMLGAVWPMGSIVPDAVSSPHINLEGAHHDDAHGEAKADAHSASAHPSAEIKPQEYIDPVTGATAKAVAQARHWSDKYEGESPSSFKDVAHYWDWPMRPAQHIQANCVRCHTDIHDIKEEAPVVYEGRALFVEMGCANCHAVDSIPVKEKPQVGPDLRHVNAKLSKEFVNSWIWSPKSFRPSTRMPHFFMLENNSSDEEIRRTRQEARAITEYLAAAATPLPPKHTAPAGAQGNPEAGKTLFTSVGCLGCHSNLNDTGEQWITLDLQKRAGLDAAKAKATFEHMTYNERQLYAVEHLGASGSLQEVPRYNDGDGTAAKPGTPRPIYMNHGPDLSAIGDKLAAGRTIEEARAWLYDWLKEPRHHSGYTVMPSLRLSDQEVLDLSAYLLSQHRANVPTKNAEGATHADEWRAALFAEDPAKLAELTAFFLRSRFSPDVADQMAVDTKELKALATTALINSVTTREQAAAKAEAMSLPQQQMVFLGQKLIAHYGCMNCHAINGMEEAASPCANLSDWGQKSLAQLDFQYLSGHKELPETTPIPMVNALSAQAPQFGESLDKRDWSQPIAKPVDAGWPHVAHERAAWLEQKLRNTRIYDRGRVLLEPKRATNPDGSLKLQPFTDASGSTGQYPLLEDRGKPYDKIKMPTFYLNEDQIHAIVTYVLSNRQPLISPRLLARSVTEQSKQIAHGRAVAERFNCVSCHQIEENVPSVQQYYNETELTTKAPPSLRGEGNKIQHGWLYNFLKHVEPIRPLPMIRMPSFPLTDEDTTALAAYFAAASKKESQWIRRTLDPIQKYIDEQAESPNASAAAGDPGDDWFKQQSLAAAAQRLRRWALDHRQMTETQFRTDINTAEDLIKSHKMLLFKAMFTAGLYDAPYPFVDSPRPTISQDRFALGEEFFHSMQCLQCHVMGDANAPGARRDATAPNLSLTHRRLQQRWVRNWVQEPPIIQAGTAMPPFFTGIDIFELHGRSWPRAQQLPPEQIAKIEARYGKTVHEQTGLLLDFLYAAGVRDYTTVQPAQLPVIPDAPPEVVERVKQELAPPAPKAPSAGDPGAKSPATPASEGTTPSPAATPAPARRAGTASISGKVTLTGTAPEAEAISMDAACGARHSDAVFDQTVVVGPNNELANVVVSISSGLGEDVYPAPSEPAVLDQNGCMYEPHVLPVMVGQKIMIKNSDPFMHNVHGFPQTRSQFNFAQPNVDPGKEIEPFRLPETALVKCDVHPWMRSYMVAIPHPFFSKTKNDGAYAIQNLPAGEYTVKAWHEKFGEIEQQVTVEDGKKVELNLSFKTK